MVRVATYNAHDCVGRDGAYSPDRIARVLLSIEADVVALQEITLDHAGDVLAQLEAATGMKAIDGTVVDRGVGRYGNVLLSRRPVVRQALHDLSYAGREPRGLVEAVLDFDDRECRVMATHLGLASPERHQQIARIAALLRGSSGSAILMGDFNVWAGATAFKPLRDAGFVASIGRSYPTWFAPLLPLDRILTRSPVAVLRCWRHQTPLTRRASDHFPIVADVRIGNPATAAGRA
jgi:endonuclease/exonuclease/phosphatase family metal-dependent hydrolase